VAQTCPGFNENVFPLDPAPVGTVQARTYGGSSTLATVRRDLRFTDHVDLFAGGGIIHQPLPRRGTLPGSRFPVADGTIDG
jgi:hypothetical protein